MRIVCPSCDATYDVPAELMAGRPVVRCVQCERQWKIGETAAQSAPKSIPDEIATALSRIPPEVVGASRTKAPAQAARPAGDDLMLAEPREPDGAAGETGEPPAVDAEPARPSLKSGLADADYDRAAIAEPVLPYTTPRAPMPPTAAAAAAELIRAQTGGGPWISRQTADLIAATGWALTVGLLVGLGWLAVQHRLPIMEAWPPSMRLYMLLGLA